MHKLWHYPFKGTPEQIRRLELHSGKVIVIFLLATFLGVLLAIAFNYSAYIKSHEDNKKLIDTLSELNSRISFALIEREANIAKAHSLETLLIQQTHDNVDVKTKILIIDETTSKTIKDLSSQSSLIPVSSTQEYACERLKEKNLPCYPQ